MLGSGRGQSVQVGVIILFAFFIIGLTLAQVFIVPSQNAEVEFNHNQQVQDDMVQLRSHLLRSVATGESWTTSVRLGTTYPSRAILLNPAPVSGSLRTQDSGAIRVENAVAPGETGDYWNGSRHTFSTSAVVYRPSYNVYDNAPTTRFQASVLSNHFGDGTVALTNQTLVNGRTITLVPVVGEYSTARTGAASVDPTVVSATNRTVAVTAADGEQLQISVDTRLPKSKWQDLLSNEINNGHVESISCSGGPANSCGTLTITLEHGVTYNLRMGEVGIGSLSDSAQDDDTARYVVTVAGDGASVDEGQSRQVTVEVRDQFNNPVANAKVAFSQPQAGYVSNRSGEVASNLSRLATVNVTTDQNGRATVTYHAPMNVRSNPSTTFAAWAPAAGPAEGDPVSLPEVAVVELTVEDTSEAVDDFDRSRPLITAVDPQHRVGEDDDLEFVHVFVPQPLENGSKWTLVDESGNKKTFSDITNVVPTTGGFYFAGDPNDFESEYNVDSERVFDLGDVTLDDSGDTVRIVFDDRRTVDAFGYSGPAVDRRYTTDGWHTPLEKDVTARLIEDTGYADANRSSDWTGLTVDEFFGRNVPRVNALGASANVAVEGQKKTDEVTFTYSVADDTGIDTVEFEAESTTGPEGARKTRTSAHGSLTLTFDTINMNTANIEIAVAITNVEGHVIECRGLIEKAGETITKEELGITC